MPFTLSHAAAVLPLPRLLGRWSVPSALVLGSFMPDMGYFLALPVWRSDTHSAAGMLWFCLPLGLLCYLAFHKLFKGPLMGLLPASWLDRLHAQAAHCTALPPVRWLAVVLCLLCGTLTHDVWDAFTHRKSWGTLALAPLQQPAFTFNGFTIYGYGVAQHSSTALGLVILAIWCWRWRQRTPAQPTRLPVTLPAAGKLAVVLLLLLAPLAVGVTVGALAAQAPAVPGGGSAWQRFVAYAVWTGLPAATLSVLVYALAWQAWLRGATRG